MKITDLAALVLALSTIGRLLIRQEEEDPQVEGNCSSCRTNPQPCCAPRPNPVPPPSVQATAAGALERRRQSRQRWRPGGTAVGIARARDLQNARNVSERTIERMHSFFSRHDTPQNRQARRDPMSPASISWDLWGGDAGRKWINEIRK